MSFRFKQFYIEDSKCAMKVGTDGVLIGCWPLAFSHSPIRRILDVGTGSGLIARMLMQRCPEAEVTGIDIDEAAVEQAKENGVRAFCSSLQNWQPETADGYDLIVSNPPYFQNSLKNPDAGRSTARHTDTLSYAELIHHSARLLTMNGQLALILPAEAEMEVRGLAAAEMLALARVTRVYSKEGKAAKRTLMAFEKFKIHNAQFKIHNAQFKILEDVLVLEDEKGGRSAAYQELTKDFYL